MLVPLIDGRDQPSLFDQPLVDEGKLSRDQNYTVVVPKHKSQRQLVMDRIISAGHRGVTRDELASVMRLPLASICGRVRELKDLGAVVDTSERRETSTGHRAAVVVAERFVGASE